jgi:hypothetical protein
VYGKVEKHLIGLLMKTKIHVNQHHIRSNKTKGTDLPVITVKQGKTNTYCNEVEILGPSRIIYSGSGCDTKALMGCGARVVIETESEVIIK